MTISLSLGLVTGAVAVPAARPARRLAEAETPPQLTIAAARLIPPAIGVATLAFLLVDRVSIMVALAIAVATAVYLTSRIRRVRGQRAAEAAVSSVLGHVVADLKAGALMSSAFSRAARDLPESTPSHIAEAFHSAAAHARRGQAAHRALARHPALAGVAQLWALAETHGLPAATLLDQARIRLETKASHRNSTAASLQGAQATSGILAFLPLVGIGLGTSMGADPAGFLFGGGLGGILLVIGVALIAGGMLTSRWILERATP